MTRIVEFFDSAILFFNDKFFGNSNFSLANFLAKFLTEIGGGDHVYGSGKQKLDDVIREYDQAVFDLTARVVASKHLSGFS